MVLELQFANMVHIFDVGTRAWQPDPTEGWVGSELVEKLVDGDKVVLVFSLENGEVSIIPISIEALYIYTRVYDCTTLHLEILLTKILFCLAKK